MNQNTMKLAAVVAVVVIVVAVAAAVLMTRGGSDSGEQRGGLYQLDAQYVEVSMGQCSATPSVINTLETVYEAYYGDLTTQYTIEDVMSDTVFWNEYCTWEPLATDNGDGTYTVTSSTRANGDETVTIPVADRMISMGTMYSECVYILLCQKYGVEPYSEAGLTDPRIGEELSSIVVGGMSYSYYGQNEADYMTSYVAQDGYLDLGVTSVQRIDPETLTAVLENAMSDGDDVVYMASGTRMSTAEYYESNTSPCRSTGAYYAFFAPTTFNDVYSCIDVIGKIMGFEQATIDAVIQDFQVRLYAVYKGVQENADQSALVYWESNSGNAVSSSMAITIMDFLGFDTRLMDGGEHDLESLLSDSPALLVYYTNDGRSMDEKMRVNN